MPQRPCLDCRTLSPGPRCPRCTAAKQQAKDQRRPNRRTAAQTARRRQAVEAYVTTHGWTCSGSPWCGPPHPSHDLTADHITDIPTAIANGQTYEQAEAGPLRILCRTANSARSANTRHTTR
jgi:5-methylcytosine-specific restriction enzyme A